MRQTPAMLSTIGDILNWLGAGVLFPLLMLPLAHLISNRLGVPAPWQPWLWALLTITITMAGIGFLYLAPGQTIEVTAPRLSLWGLGVIALAGAMHLTGGTRVWGQNLARAAAQISRVAARTVMWLVLAMALVQFTVVILRYVFGLGFIWMQESIVYMHGAVFLLAAGYALITDDHVRVDLFYRGASEHHKAMINLLGTYLFLFPVCLLLLWTASPYIYASWQATEGSIEPSGLQLLYLLKSLIPAFAVLLALAGYTIAMQAAQTLSMPRKSRGQQ